MDKLLYNDNWGKTVKKTLIDREMTITELAAEIGYSRNHVSAAVNNRLIYPEVINAINSYLELSNKQIS